MQSTQYVQEWLQIHRTLMDMEAAFTDLALKAVDGEVAPADLDEARSRLMHTREQCTAAYERAFPKRLQQPTKQ
jgi:hypothetical protein